jgi:hypothetical protein
MRHDASRFVHIAEIIYGLIKLHNGTFGRLRLSGSATAQQQRHSDCHIRKYPHRSEL